MSSCDSELHVQAPLEETLAICLSAVQSAGWTKTQPSSDGASMANLIGKEPWTFSFHNAAKVELEIQYLGGRQCVVRISVSNLGFGPIQSGYVRGRLADLINAINVAARNASIPAPTTSPSGWDLLTPEQKAASQHYAWQQQQARHRK